MTKENKALVSTEDIATLRALSGEEENKSSFTYLPVVKVSNKKVEKEVDGEKVDVLGKKEFLVTTRQNSEYITESFGESFSGVVLKIKYMVTEKYNPKTQGQWRSYEFSNFTNSIIELRDSEGNIFFEGLYSEFKQEFEGKYDLHAIAYVMTGEDKLVKADFKGASRSSFWDYMNSFSSEDSITAHQTKFSVKKDKNQAGLPYHVAEFSVDENTPVELGLIKQAQASLAEYLDSFEKKDRGNKSLDTKELEQAF